MEPKGRYYLTTAIDYINAKPHIGHAYEKVAADVLARHYRKKLGADRVRFLTGTDEHGAKIAKAAEEAGQPVEEFAAETAAKFSFAWDQLGVAPDRFIRTTDLDHVEVVEDIMVKMKDRGYLYEGEYSGLYCTACEAFYTEKDAGSGLCPVHKTKLELLKEQNWFLKVSELIPTIKQKVESGELSVWPAERKREVLNMLEDFSDLAISRPNVRWGIPLPWDERQTVYVWVDALINYVSGARDGSHDWWPADVHVVGKDISKFHCIVWPAILLAAGLPLPKEVVVHGYLTVGGEKMSKSTGNVIDPNDWVARYGADPVRYLLMREVAFGQDGDVSEEKLKARYGGDLANGLGNLLSRVTTLVEKHLGGVLPEGVAGGPGADPTEVDRLLESYRFHDALAKVWEWVAWGNKLVDEKKLWELHKTDPSDFARTARQIVEALKVVAEKLEPFMPEAAARLKAAVSAERIVKAEPLFPRIP